MANFLTRYREDSIWDARGVLGFMLAPLVSGLILAYSLRAHSSDALMNAMSLSYMYSLMLGLPAAFLLNRFRKVSLFTTSLASMLMGGVSWLTILALFPGSGDEVAITLWFSIMGLAAGITWWFIACFKNTSMQRNSPDTPRV